ncbi:peptidoglycan DD-metalloendopeptidase family protein [bacterium]|nr:peptidoglycan DD-metalloendopeptidase family protein [bacterium]MBU1994808.1 peptidoglycan DD-metalloendopeptidase family protein [bacterium]
MKNSRGKSSLGTLFFVGLVIGAVVFGYNSSMFERDVPEVNLSNNGYWNLKEPLKIAISDTSGISAYKVFLKTQSEDIPLNSEQFIHPQNKVSIEVDPHKSAYMIKEESIKIIIEATDASKWNFLNGNQIKKEYTLKIDKKRPNVAVLSNSYKITQGGAALVVFKAEDENLKDISIQTNYGKVFKAQPFYKEGYYISLLAWPVTQADFKATVVVEDEAGNITKTYIPFYLKSKEYKTSNIKLTDSFLKGKIAELAEEFEETHGVTSSLEQFKIINEDVRAKNEKLIHDITSKVSSERITNFKINKMYPLKNAQVVAQFGDYRKYSYADTHISESYHLGLDLASHAMAEIKPQNGGNVVYSNFNGLYGNMPIIDHGLGLYTLYGHCSSASISSGEVVKEQQHIANTGKSGYAMGDHLHFGVLIQGIEVRPAEWMDDSWIKLNIYDVIKSAKEIIDRN